MPIIGFLPHTVVLSILAIRAAGFRASNDSKISVELFTEKNAFVNLTLFKEHFIQNYEIKILITLKVMRNMLGRLMK